MNRRKDGLYEDTITINGKRKHVYGKTKSEVYGKIRALQETAKNGLKFEEAAD